MSQINVASLFSQSFLKESSLHQTLGEEFALGENGVIVFHWADFHETCDSVKLALENEPELLEKFCGAVRKAIETCDARNGAQSSIMLCIRSDARERCSPRAFPLSSRKRMGVRGLE